MTGLMSTPTAAPSSIIYHSVGWANAGQMPPIIKRGAIWILERATRNDFRGLSAPGMMPEFQLIRVLNGENVIGFPEERTPANNDLRGRGVVVNDTPENHIRSAAVGGVEVARVLPRRIMLVSEATTWVNSNLPGVKYANVAFTLEGTETLRLRDLTLAMSDTRDNVAAQGLQNTDRRINKLSRRYMPGDIIDTRFRITDAAAEAATLLHRTHNLIASHAFTLRASVQCNANDELATVYVQPRYQVGPHIA